MGKSNKKKAAHLSRNAVPVRVIAETLDCTPQTIRNHCRTGRLPHKRIGRRIFITRKDLDAYLGRTTRRELFPGPYTPTKGR